jgi:hypothetical protein
MSYSLYDFTESIDRSSIDVHDILKVCAAWGGSPEGFGSWEGGFLIELRNRGLRPSRFLYLTGWCDTTGWGCQDGIDERFFDKKPSLQLLQTFTITKIVSPKGTVVEERPKWMQGYSWKESPEGWDEEPTDLNRWVWENNSR